MRILVTGAGGFVGRHVARALAKSGHDVLASVHRSVPDSLSDNPALRVVRFDMTASEPLDMDGSLDGVVHCAAALPSVIQDPDQLYRINVNGMERLLEGALKAGARSFVSCSSMSAFGKISDSEVTLDTPSIEPDAYGRAKLESERLLAEASSAGLSGLSIRLPGVVGLGSHDNFLSGAMARILKGEPVAARNPDALFNNIVHVDNLAGFMAARLRATEAGHWVTTLAAEKPLPIKRVLQIMFEEAGVPENLTFSVGGSPFLIDTAPARALGFRPPTTEDCVRRFARENAEAPA
ncbi:MAG: NAD(P)-dependent oxidoreductase [Pseudomonadota bacterium]